MSSKYAKQYCERCPDFLAVQQEIAGTKKRPGTMSIEDVDWDHLHSDHVRVWGEYGWKELEQTKKECSKLQNEIKQLRAQLATRSATAPAKAAATSDLIVNPANHVEGFCDALVARGYEIYKCTEVVRYGQNVCPLHTNHKQLIKK